MLACRGVPILLCALLCAALPSAFAKGPESSRKSNAPRVGSLTPPPKDWQPLFPQDDGPPQTAGQNSSASGGSASQTGGENSGGLVSAPNARHAQRDLPWFWLLVTGALSAVALAACGSLILRKDEPQLLEDPEEQPLPA